MLVYLVRTRNWDQRRTTPQSEFAQTGFSKSPPGGETEEEKTREKKKKKKKKKKKRNPYLNAQSTDIRYRSFPAPRPEIAEQRVKKGSQIINV